MPCDLGTSRVFRRLRQMCDQVPKEQGQGTGGVGWAAFEVRQTYVLTKVEPMRTGRDLKELVVERTS